MPRHMTARLCRYDSIKVGGRDAQRTDKSTHEIGWAEHAYTPVYAHVDAHVHIHVTRNCVAPSPTCAQSMLSPTPSCGKAHELEMREDTRVAMDGDT